MRKTVAIKKVRLFQGSSRVSIGVSGAAIFKTNLQKTPAAVAERSDNGKCSLQREAFWRLRGGFKVYFESNYT